MLQDRIDARAAETPDAPAVITANGALSYRELVRRANGLAAQLVARGIRRGDRVALLMHRSARAIAAQLAVAKIGAVYVPVDPSYPEPRVRLLLEDAAPALIMRAGDVLSAGCDEPPRVATAPDDPLYIMYTSGSTGRPKGVVVQHRNVLALLDGLGEASLLRSDRVLHYKSPSFDPSVFETWGTLCAGGTVLVYPTGSLSVHALGAFLAAHRATVMLCTASLFNLMVEHRLHDLRGLRMLVSGGEPASLEHFRRAHSALSPATQLYNHYGPTECTVVCVLYRQRGDESVMPIGRPLASTRFWIEDGELVIGGAQVAAGYFGQAEATAERFGHRDGVRTYRTGDRVSLDAAGALLFHGRADQQVKIRGYRIELGEVEAALRAAPNVTDACAAVRADARGRGQLLAWVVGSTAGLRAWLLEQVPAHNVPTRLMAVDALPMDANGKVDRTQLLAGSEFLPGRAPSTDVERAVCAVFREVFGRDVGVDTEFVEAGGDSVHAAEVAARLTDALSATVDAYDVLDAGTAEVLARRLAIAGTAPTEERIPRAPAGPVPLSPPQRRLWFLDRLGGSGAYSESLTMELRGALDVGALERALFLVAQRQSVLRTRYPVTDGAPHQVVDGEMPPVRRERHSGPNWRARCLADTQVPFDLGAAPPWRILLLELGAEHHVLHFVIHHIGFDGWSIRVLRDELNAAWGRATPLPPLDCEVRDHAYQAAADAPSETRLAHWHQRLADLPPLLDLPRARPRSIQGESGAELRWRLSDPLPAGVRALGAPVGATPFMVCMAAFAVVLHRWSGQSALVLGTPVAHRSPQLRDVIGMFVRTAVVRLDIDPTGSVQALLAAVRQSCIEATRPPVLPFENLVERLAPERNLGHHPIFQVLFSWQLSRVEETLIVPGIEVRQHHVHNGRTKFDLHLALRDGDGGWEVALEYDAALFDEPAMARLGEHVHTVLADMIARPEARVFELELCPPEEQRQRAATYGTAVSETGDETLHSLILAACRRHPDAIAIEEPRRDGTVRQVSYAALAERSARLAGLLQHHGVRPGDRVGLFLERSAELVIGTLAALRAGAAYVPLDPGYPEERLVYMLRDAGIRVLLTQRVLAPHAPAGAEVLLEADREHPPHPFQESAGSGADSFYVIYTSGSTGRPKGVVMPHSAMVNMVRWQVQQSHEQPRTLQFAPLSFDVSAQEIGATLLAGGTLITVSERVRRDSKRLIRHLIQHRVSRLFLPFVALDSLAEVARREPAPTCLAEVITAGEQLRITPAVRAFFLQLRGCSLANHYGPSETHLATAHTLSGRVEDWPDLPPIGRPITGCTAIVVDERGRHQPIGVPGELVLGGAGVANGYLGHPELSAQRFIDGAYHTGDLARFRDDGVLEFLGRCDRQVKIRGYRVEPGEVESALSAQPDVRAAAVAVRGETAATRRLVAYVVGDTTPRRLQRALKTSLPTWMVPATYTMLDALPTTPSGKVDYASLPDPDAAWRKTDASFVPPASMLELSLIQIWEDVLDTRPISADSDFFEVGGSSLSVISMLAAIEKRLGADLSPATVFSSPRLNDLARAIGQRMPSEAESPLVPMAVRDSGIPLILVPGMGGAPWSMYLLARSLALVGPVYAMQRPGAASDRLLARVEDIAAHHVRVLREHRLGPAVMVGYSFGAWIAFEMVRLLGRDARALIVLDMPPPGARPRGASFDALAVSEAISPELASQMRADAAAADVYQPSNPSEISALVVRGSDWPDGAEWSHFLRCSQSLEVSVGHADLLREPSVQTVAEQIRSYLARTDA